MEELTKALEPLLIQLTAMVEVLIELAGGLIDNPVGLLILLVVVPTILGFCWNIISTVFEIIFGAINMVMEISFLILCKLPIKGYKLIKRVSSKKKITPNQNEFDEEFGRKHGYADESEYQRIEFGEPPKKVKSLSPEQDLATSLKSNLLDP